jgi:cytochrome c oxidase cbb3-type subunit III
MKPLHPIALAILLGSIVCVRGPARMYAASARSSAENTQSESPTASANASGSRSSATGVHAADPAELGGALFGQHCAFCHGRDAGGGETGPDLTQSKLVSQDVGGNKISEVLRDGRPDKGMPSFTFSGAEVEELAAFLHAQRAKALLQNGNRRGVAVADLQTGNAAAGQRYFNGAGGCASCHSPTGDLAGIASRYQGLELEERMLAPPNVKRTVTVTFSSGKTVIGTLAYLDEFTVGLRDASGTYRSWPVSSVRYSVTSPADAHIALFAKYTDADIHNLMAYLQTLR